jgi:hypothetical protein
VGVYNGDRVQLVCGAFGDPVGPYNDTAWSYVTNLSRSVGNGWVNEHFINDGAADNSFVSGEPMCGSNTPGAPGNAGSGSSPSPGSSGSGAPPASGNSPVAGPTPSPLHSGGVLYYSPYNGDAILYHGRWKNAPAPAQIVWHINFWDRSPECPASDAVPQRYDGEDAGREITTLAAWSKARNVPFSFLSAPPAWAGQINYILLFDPGNKSEYDNAKCTNSRNAASKLAT